MKSFCKRSDIETFFVACNIVSFLFFFFFWNLKRKLSFSFPSVGEQHHVWLKPQICQVTHTAGTRGMPIRSLWKWKMIRDVSIEKFWKFRDKKLCFDFLFFLLTRYCSPADDLVFYRIILRFQLIKLFTRCIQTDHGRNLE